MAEDANARIRVDIDTAAALASIKNLQRQISNFHTSMAKSGAAASAASMQLQQQLLNSINSTGKFSATLQNVKTTTDSFTNSLEKNKLSMGEYFRYSGGATKTFGRLFRTEFDTINKVARERVKDLQTQYIKMGREANGAMRAIAVRPLVLDMKDLGTQTQIAAQRQALLNQMLKQGSTNLLNFGKNTQWAGRQLMVGFTIPLVMFGTVAAKTFMDVEKQAIRFKRVYGEMFTTTEETTKALEEIKNLASEFTKYGIAVSKTMELAADIAATGKMGADLTAQVAEATRLAVLGGVEQAEALKATISLTDAFGVSAEQLAGKIDFLNAVENQTVTSIEDLTIAIPKAGPVVQQLGGDVQDLTFFLTAMREGGINASEGANALKSGLASMINPTGKAAEMLQGFGINLKGIVDANKGNVKGIVVDFAKALDTLDPLNRAQAIEQLFGKFQFARLSTLFQNVIKEGNQASRVLKLTNATTEELAILSERELKKVEDSPMFKFQKAVEDIKVTLVPLGEAFLKAVTPVLEFGTKILEKFNDLDAGAKQFVVGLTAIAGVIGPVFLMGFGLIANGVANVIKGFVFFKTAMNKAGSASTQLGVQTEYMTQQQLEASAVAASLDQVHQKLRQTFTSEAGAVDALTAAYRRSLAAQTAMSGGVIGRTRVPRKYASGVLSVPGPKGAGDVVPAMLSPGEAVIPAKQASKYSGFISSMISDDVPGFRFGLNPFASMLKRARVGTRMSSTSFSEALATGNKKYQSGFATGSGDDFLTKYGMPKSKQKGLRTNLEQAFFGLSPSTNPQNRPSYGFASASPLQAILNTILFGKTGSRMSGAMNPLSRALDRYGDISLIGKRSLSNRSSAYAGDVLLDYSRAPGATNKSFPYSSAPMIGGTQSQLDSARFGSFGQPFGSVQTGPNQFTTNRRPPYIETYTPGGFRFNEIEKIITRDKALAAQLQAELKAAGLGNIRVKAPNFIQTLLSKIGLPGYANGVFSVPGPKGAGDVVPSMLSPGEAVIPARQAEKYSDLVRSMIADNVPGFEKSNIKDKSGMVVKDVKLGSGAGAFPAAATDSSNVKAYTNATMFLPSEDNEALRAGKADPSKLAASIRSGGALATSPLITEIVRSMGFSSQAQIDKALKDPAIRKDLSSFANSFSTRLANEVASSKGPMTDAKFAKISDKIAKEEAAKRGPAFAKATQQVLTRITTFEDKSVERINKEGKARARGRSQVFANVPSYKNKRDSYMGTGAALGLSGTMPAKAVMAHITDPIKVALSKLAVSGPLTATAQQARKLLEAGKKIVYREGDASKKATVPVNTTAKDSIAKLESETSKTNAKTVKEEAKTTKEKAKVVKEDSKTTKTKAATVKVEKETQVGAKRADAARKGWETRRAKAIANQTIDPDAPESGKRRMGAGTVGMVASAAVMGGSMLPGEIGKISQELMMPVMILSMLQGMQLLKHPLAKLAVVLAGVVVAGFALKAAFDEAQAKTMDMAEALGSGNESVEDYAKFAGKVSAGEIMDRRRSNALSPFPIQTGKTTFGEAFVQSERGKALADSTKQSISSIGSSATQSQLVNQLATSVLAGSLDAGQARSIASNIANQIGDISFGIDVNARLIELLGPNGENLIKDPLLIAVKLSEDTRSRVSASGANLSKMKNPFEELGLAALTTGTAAGTGAAIGGAIGSPTVIGAPIGAAIGAVAGTIAGIGITAGTVVKSFQDMGVASGAVVASGILAMQQHQEMLDALDIEYERRIQNATLAGDIEKAERLTTEHIQGREALLLENAKTTAAVIQNYKNADFAGKMALEAAANKSIERAYENDPTMQALAVSTGSQIDSAAGLDSAQKIEMKLLIGSKELDPLVATGLLNTFAGDSEVMTNVLNVMTNLGTADGERAIQTMMLFKDKDGNPLKQQQTDFIAKIKAEPSSTKAAKLISFYQNIAQFGSILDVTSTLEFLEKDPGAAEKIQKKFEKIQNLKGPIDISVLTKVLGEKELATITDDLENFNKLTDAEKKVYANATVILTSSVVSNTDPKVVDWLKTPEGTEWAAADPATQVREYVQSQVNRIVDISSDTSLDPNAGTQKPTGTGAPASSVLDDIVNRLRNVRRNQIAVTNGWSESAAVLSKLFGGKEGMGSFSGIEQDMRRLGASEDLITLIAGMPPEEFQKRKNQLFRFDKETGNIIGFKKLLKDIGAGLVAANVGDFVNSQQKVVTAASDQLKARNLLIKAGFSYAESVELSRQADVAAAYADARATKGKKKRAAAIAEVTKALRDGINAEKSIQTAEEKFAGLYDRIQQKLDADKTAIELKFKLDTAADDKIILDAQNKIAEIQYKIDDQEAGLTLISEKEEVINEKYDKRLDALDRIKSVNDAISQQQRNQLSLADALSSGDIGAAARAMQQIQEDFVGQSSAKQKDLIEKARQQELLKVSVLINGELKTREQIEKTIKDLQKEIFELEEKSLEPAVERNRLLAVARDASIKSLDLEADKWAALELKINLAKTSVENYAKALVEANGLAVQAVKDIDSGNPPATPTTPPAGGSTPTENTFKGTRPGPDREGKKGEVWVGPEATWKHDGTKWNKISDVGQNNQKPPVQNTNTNAANTDDRTKKEKEADSLRTQITNNTTKITEINKSISAMERNLPSLEKAFNDANWALKTAKQGNINERRKVFDDAKARLERTEDSIEDLKGDRTVLGVSNQSLKNKLTALGLRSGGFVSGPGTATSDSVPAMLSNGEYVINAASVNKFGQDFLDNINAGRLPGFKKGGIVNKNKSQDQLEKEFRSQKTPKKSTSNPDKDRLLAGVQFFKDYIFDFTNPLDYALAFVPGTKPAISAGKAAAGAAKAARVAPKISKKQKSAVTGDEVMSIFKREFQANNPNQLPLFRPSQNSGVLETTLSQYSKVWDSMDDTVKSKIIKNSDSHKIADKESFLKYIEKSGTGFAAVAPDSLDDVSKLNTLINQQYAKTILNLDPKNGTIKFYRNTKGKHDDKVTEGRGYYSLDRHMAYTYAPGNVPGSYHPTGSRVTAKAKPGEFHGLLGTSSSDEFAANINPKLINPKNYSVLGDKRLPKTPSWYSTPATTFGGGNSPYRFFSLLNQVSTPTSIKNFKDLTLKKFLRQSNKTIDDFKALYYKKYPLKEGQQGLFATDFDDVKDLFSTDLKNPSKIGLDIPKLDDLKISQGKKEKYLQFIDIMQELSGQRIFNIRGIPKFAMGGMVKLPKREPAPMQMAFGGMVKPKYFNTGGFAMGTDTIPSMLTPGEFVVQKRAVENFGVDNLNAINSGTSLNDSVYNYSINVNVKTDANANQIAQTVMTQIKQIDSQRIRGVGLR